MRFLRISSGWRLAARGEIKCTDDHGHCGNGEDQGEIKSAALRLRRIGNLDLRLFVHKYNPKFRMFRAGEGKFRRCAFEVSIASEPGREMRVSGRRRGGGSADRAVWRSACA